LFTYEEEPNPDGFFSPLIWRVIAAWPQWYWADSSAFKLWGGSTPSDVFDFSSSELASDDAQPSGDSAQSSGDNAQSSRDNAQSSDDYAQPQPIDQPAAAATSNSTTSNTDNTTSSVVVNMR